MAYEGECSKGHVSCSCQSIYLPVCGVDHQTYPNVCELKCRYSDVQLMSGGLVSLSALKAMLPDANCSLAQGSGDGA